MKSVFYIFNMLILSAESLLLKKSDKVSAVCRA